MDKIIRKENLKDFTSDKKNKIGADPVKLLVKLKSYRLFFKTIREKNANVQGFGLDKRLGLVILISS